MKITIQQMKYLTKTAETGSMTRAAQELSISQATLSEAISQVENELGFKVFNRGRRGITPTKKGVEVLGYARRISSGMDSFEQRYSHEPVEKTRFAVSSNSFRIARAAFNNIVNRPGNEKYDLSLNIRHFLKPAVDVCTGASDLGIIYSTKTNEDYIGETLQTYGLEFYPLIEGPLFAYLSKSHPLAKKEEVTRAELAPYPYFPAEQTRYLNKLFSGNANAPKQDKVKATDSNNTDFRFRVEYVSDVNGYYIWCRLYPAHQPNENEVALPIVPQEVMTIGYVIPAGTGLSTIASDYIDAVTEYGRIGIKR